MGLGLGESRAPFARNPITALFTTGVNGAWYDPSDFSTMFQDAAGTTPVTAVGQPVGLMLDKSKGLVLGSELVYTSSISGLPAGGGTRFYPVNMQNLVAGKAYKIIFTISNYTGTGFVGLAGSAPAGIAQLRYPGNGAFSCIQTPTGNGGIVFFTLTTNTADFSNISVRELPGNHAYNPSGNSANFPVLQQDGTGRYYLAFNGVNQWLQTNSIDFTYGDNMFVSAGVRKLSDAAGGVVAELSAAVAANNGSFYLAAPNGPGTSEAFSAKGTTQITAGNSSLTSPITTVVTGIADIAGATAVFRTNSAISQTTSSSMGTGNYGNYPLYIGARAGSSLWFNGRLYGLVVAGKQASPSEIASTEAWLNQKTGAY